LAGLAARFELDFAFFGLGFFFAVLFDFALALGFALVLALAFFTLFAAGRFFFAMLLLLVSVSPPHNR
jgi:hypothetical protein